MLKILENIEIAYVEYISKHTAHIIKIFIYIVLTWFCPSQKTE